MAVEAPEVDGRRLRRAQNREAVLDALVALFRAGVYQPGTALIAERAGLSHRSLFRYFDDADDLHRAAIERALAAARPLLDPRAGPTDPLPDKVDAIVAARVRLFETIAPAARAARAGSHRQPVVAAQLDEARSYLRHQVRRLFAPELEGDGAALLPAIDVLCSFESYDLLRRDQGMTRAEVREALVTALTALLAGGARP